MKSKTGHVPGQAGQFVPFSPFFKDYIKTTLSHFYRGVTPYNPPDEEKEVWQMERALREKAIELLGEKFYPYVVNREKRYPSQPVWEYALLYLFQARFPNTTYMDKALQTAWGLLKTRPHLLLARIKRVMRRLQEEFDRLVRKASQSRDKRDNLSQNLAGKGARNDRWNEPDVQTALSGSAVA
jgi:hypothetical protein